MSGAGKYLKEKNPKIRVIAGDPVGSLYTHYHRTRTMGEGHPVQGRGDRRRQDSHDASGSTGSTSSGRCPTGRRLAMARRLAREEGIFVGGSAGLNVALALELAREAGRSQRDDGHHPLRHR